MDLFLCDLFLFCFSDNCLCKYFFVLRKKRLGSVDNGMERLANINVSKRVVFGIFGCLRLKDYICTHT